MVRQGKLVYKDLFSYMEHPSNPNYRPKVPLQDTQHILITGILKRICMYVCMCICAYISLYTYICICICTWIYGILKRRFIEPFTRSSS